MRSRRFSKRRSAPQPGRASSTSAAAPAPRKSAWRGCGSRRCDLVGVDLLGRSRPAPRSRRRTVSTRACSSRRGRVPPAVPGRDPSIRRSVWPFCSTSATSARARRRAARASPGRRAASSSSNPTTPRGTGSAPFRAGCSPTSSGAGSSPACAAARGEATDSAVGPLIPGMFVAPASSPCRFSCSRCSSLIWDPRQRHCGRAGGRPSQRDRKGARRVVQALGTDYLKAIERYAQDADRAGTSFVEIQNTMLFATVGSQRDV